ncbi:DUF2510 domain-containing protein [Streptomyces colonosanans]|uniref:DUF2510 domain-containing protein n=1 Tax=Streptomyces colonosanans TaxID=1428652 RepID=A0A1S2PFM8_9ACTN|nr:DUF2510 domain-containing protein [Streptomyces colonosanans]OIJ92513.1 hypothetical protein BIV24_13385 [Streptomyces colonosanans]
MSSAPPPGWYRDPSYPLTERWWDGVAWSDHRRQPQMPEPPLASPPAPTPPGRGGPRRTNTVVLTLTGVVLAAAVVTGAVVLGRGGGGAAQAETSPTAATSPPTHGASSPPPSASATGDPNVVTDELNGITFPVIEGWTGPDNVADDDIVLSTPGTYHCPGDPGLCEHGQVSSRTAAAGVAPETLAKGDIEDAANTVYDRDGTGSKPFGGITSHRLVKSGQIAVAGRAGYFVRWRVTTAKGPGGYVQTLAFPSSAGSQAPVLVRFAFDAGPDGPPLADMDRITRGIRPVDDAATGGGVGSSIGTGR